MQPEGFGIGTRRRCDNDGKFYLVKARHHRFCKAECKAEYHRFGSPLLRLRDHLPAEILRVVEPLITAAELRIFKTLEPEQQTRYRRAFKTHAALLDRIWGEEEIAS